MTMVKIALAQINPVLGDLAGNAQLVLAQAQAAADKGAKVLLTPELVLTSCGTKDLLLRPAFVLQAQQTFEMLCQSLAQHRGLAVVIGHTHFEEGQLFNAASVVLQGRVVARSLQQYGSGAHDILNQGHYFTAGNGAAFFEHGGMRFGVTVGYDTWHEQQDRQMRDIDVQCWLSLGSSVFHLGSFEDRLLQAGERATSAQTTLLHVSRGAAQGELVFEGASFAVSQDGEIQGHMPFFDAALAVLAIDEQGAIQDVVGSWVAPAQFDDEQQRQQTQLARIWQALVVAVRDYVKSNGFEQVLIGLSGGMDSALVLAIAVDALGAENVTTVMMPSDYTADISLEDAQKMARGLGVRYEIIPIGEMTGAFERALAPMFEGLAADTTEENIQARTRGNLLMSISNKLGSLVLTTGNKSELATGYCTLYGDMVGAYSVLQDVPKTLVYRLARWRNEITQVIPQRIITRAPSAELRADQTDQDSLPPYDVLDAIIEGYVDQNLSLEQLVAKGMDQATVDRIIRLIRISEYKRRQAAPGPKITARSFSWDWHYPLTHAFREKLVPDTDKHRKPRN